MRWINVKPRRRSQGNLHHVSVLNLYIVRLSIIVVSSSLTVSFSLPRLSLPLSPPLSPSLSLSLPPSPPLSPSLSFSSPLSLPPSLSPPLSLFVCVPLVYNPATLMSDAVLQGYGNKMGSTVGLFSKWEKKYFMLYPNRLEWSDSYQVTHSRNF